MGTFSLHAACLEDSGVNVSVGGGTDLRETMKGKESWDKYREMKL